MQTILGSTGVLGLELAKNLARFTDRVRMVSRDPKPVNPTDEPITADLLDARQVMNVVQGSEVVYLTAGLRYDHRVWENEWPLVMGNVIDACRKHKSKLVFFDNVYAYGKVDGWMKEETPYRAVARKGKVRAGIAEMLMEEVRGGNLQGMIVRAADFYGPKVMTSFVNVMVIENLRKGKKAQWMISDQLKHSFTYVPDAGKATALLGNTPTAYDQVWHLPADSHVLTGKEFIEIAAKALGVEPKTRILAKWMIRLAGLTNAVARESLEMMYQYDSDYLFGSSKFENAFPMRPTPYAEGIKATVEATK